jgi:hypothetical protein
MSAHSRIGVSICDNMTVSAEVVCRFQAVTAPQRRPLLRRFCCHLHKPAASRRTRHCPLVEPERTATSFESKFAMENLTYLDLRACLVVMETFISKLIKAWLILGVFGGVLRNHVGIFTTEFFQKTALFKSH